MNITNVLGSSITT